MLSESEDFILALKENNLNKIRKIPKGEFHNHSPLGFDLEILKRFVGIKIPHAKERMSYKGFEKYISTYLKPFFNNKNIFEFAIAECFKQAKTDGVIKLEMSTSYSHIKKYNNSPEELGLKLIEIKEKNYPELDYIPELSLRREKGARFYEKGIFGAIESGIFGAIDLMGDELSYPTSEFKRIYKYAFQNKLKLKAHVGEFGKAEDIVKAIEELNLNAVQHGIAAISSKKVMNWLSIHNIPLNLCPTSNICLTKYSTYNSHPIKVLIDNGVRVTINTDDMIIFNKSLSEEYLMLYNYNVLSATELNQVRMKSISYAN